MFGKVINMKDNTNVNRMRRGAVWAWKETKDRTEHTEVAEDLGCGQLLNMGSQK
jgi:hypothetical protein